MSTNWTVYIQMICCITFEKYNKWKKKNGLECNYDVITFNNTSKYLKAESNYMKKPDSSTAFQESSN